MWERFISMLRYFYSRLRWWVSLVRSGPENVKVGLTSVDDEPQRSSQPLTSSGKRLSDKSVSPPVKLRPAKVSTGKSKKE